MFMILISGWEGSLSTSSHGRNYKEIIKKKMYVYVCVLEIKNFCISKHPINRIKITTHM